MTPKRTSTTSLVCLLALAALALASLQNVEAACPFDDGSCQDYCNQQGCNLGYCGHFAWIQCICRKCGDEWNWYDKVHYKPDKQVNQTELDSLKLNGSVPLILTNTNAKRVDQKAKPTENVEAPKGAQPVSLAHARQVDQSATKPATGQPAGSAAPAKQAEQQQKVTATLTTLLIPDLSDGSKLDLNDIPDENSEKFLDYLTKNHEKLVQATHSVQQRGSSARSAPSLSSSLVSSSQQDNDDELAGDESDAEQQVTTPDASSEGEESVEIQISSSNNNQPPAQQQSATTSTTATTTTVANARPGSGGARSLASSDDVEEGDQQQASGPMMHLLRMAVVERSSDDIY